MSIQKEVEAFLIEHPTILENLNEELINYSSLARKIIKETLLKPKGFDAILVAIRRYKEKNKKSLKEKRDLNAIIRKSNLEVKNKQAVIILDKSVPLRSINKIAEEVEKEKEQFSLSQTAHAITIILPEKFIGLFSKLEPYLIKRSEELISLTIHSPENLEEAPGFISHLTTLLASKGINMVEITSCYTDTIIILEKEDVEKALLILNF